MRKWLIAIAVVFFLLLGSVYLFIPNYIYVHQSLGIPASRPGLYRGLLDDNSWTRWWPGDIERRKSGPDSYRVGSRESKITEIKFLVVAILRYRQTKLLHYLQREIDIGFALEVINFNRYIFCTGRSICH